MGEGKYFLDLLRRGDLVQDPPAPLLRPGGGGELDPVAPAILAVDVEVEDVSLLQVVYQSQRNVEKAGRTRYVKSANNL